MRLCKPRALSLMAFSCLAGCAVGPKFHTPAPPTSARYAPQPLGPIAMTPGVVGGGAQTVTASQTVDAQWWRSFGSPELDAMVDEALKANPDLKSADAALRQAQALLAAQKASLLPTADFGYQGQQAKTSDAIAPVLANNSNLYTLHTAQIIVSYTVDAFGGLARQVEATKAQRDAARYQYDAARLTLIANVVAGAIQEASLSDQIAAARETADAARQVLTLLQKQAQFGEIGQIEVAAQEAQVAQADQALPPLLKALDQQQSALAILLGREPGQGAPASLALGDVTLPAQLPLLLPADLVRHRPDVGAAEANLHAASAEVGVAAAARLPNIALSAVGGGASTELRTLLASGNNFWTLTGGVTQPIFDAGALKQKQKAAEAAYDQAQAQYRSTVLSALKNVADALDALSRDADALKTAAAAETASRRSLDFARNSQRLGQVGALEVLAAEQTYAQSHSVLVVASAARYADTAALFQALGGGA